MDQKQVRKNVRGVRNAVDFVILQLHYSALYCNGACEPQRINGLTDDSLRLALHALRENCDSFMQDDQQALTLIGQSVAALATARSVLQQELIWECDDNESMRFMQFNFLADALRVLHERVMDAVNCGASQQN